MTSTFPRHLLLPLIGALAATAASCGARTTIPDLLQATAASSTGGSGPGSGGAGGNPGTGGSTTTTGTGGQGAGGGTVNPVISLSDDSFIESETSTAVAPNGFVAVAWIDILQNGASRIGYAISTDDGKILSRSFPAESPDGRLASDPVLAVDTAGSFYLSWVGYYVDATGTPSDMHVYVAKAPAGSTNFGEPVEVSDPSGSADFHDKPWIAVANDGTLLVTYAVFNNFSSKLVVARSKDANTWVQSSILESASTFYNLAYPCVPKNGSRIYTTYLSITDVARVGLTFSDDKGATWTPLIQNTKVSLPDENVAFTDPTCVAEGNEVWISYGLTNQPLMGGEDGTPRLFSIRSVRSTDGGASIDLRLEAGDTQAAPFFLLPSLVREDSGAIDVTYYAGTMDEDSEGSFRRARMVDPSVGFLPSEVIEKPVIFLESRADPRWLGDYTGLATRGERLYASYVVNNDGTAHIAFARPALP